YDRVERPDCVSRRGGFSGAAWPCARVSRALTGKAEHRRRAAASGLRGGKRKKKGGRTRTSLFSPLRGNRPWFGAGTRNPPAWVVPPPGRAGGLQGRGLAGGWSPGALEGVAGGLCDRGGCGR